MYDGELSKRAYRWKLLIEEYDYTLKHISGEKNKDADLLSRYLLRIEIKFTNRNNLLKLPTIKHAKLMNTDQIRVESPKNEQENSDVVAFLRQIHEDMVHPWIVVTEKTLRRYVCLKEIRKWLKNICNECIVCNKEKEYTSNYGIPNFSNNVSKKDDVIAN
ncbi:hypothetical protein DMUE_4663 [Dictyocoela muelleri]|nr:hypothetical protein DMUE_4663 [Dictyocoela muelleri]